mgnify:CR=1 FL=1
MNKYIPHIISLGLLGLTAYTHNWVNFALFCVMTGYTVYSEVMSARTIKNDYKQEIERLNGYIKTLDERTLSLQTGISQLRSVKPVFQR